MISNKFQVSSDINKKYIDTHRFMQSVIFFLNSHAGKYLDIFDKFHVVIYDRKDCQGCCFAIKNNICAVINIDEVEKAHKDNISMNSLRRSFFLVVLHEIGHAIALLEKHSTSGNPTLEATDDQINESIKAIREKCLEEDMSKMEISRQIPDEIKADEFAFMNIAYFESLYEFNGALV